MTLQQLSFFEHVQGQRDAILKDAQKCFQETKTKKKK